jgi:hypothetical protein
LELERTRVIIRNKGLLDFSTGNYDLKLAAGSSIEIEEGGQIGAEENCSNSDLITIGDVKIASCQGGGGLINFPDLVKEGGYSSINATASTICNSEISTITATASPSSGATFWWYDAPSGGNVLQEGGSTYDGDPLTTYVSATYEAINKTAAYTTVRKRAKVTVKTNTWNGTTWSQGIVPTLNDRVVFTGDYPPAADPNVDILACSCTVTGSKNVVIKSGITMKVVNEVIIEGSGTGVGTLTFETNASLVQVNDAAVNTGVIIYKRTTGDIFNTDYVYWSSPVTGDDLGAIQTGTLYYSFNAAANSWPLTNETSAC